MAAAWVQLAVLVFCSTTIAVLTTAEDGLEYPLQGPPDKPLNVRFESVNFNHTLRWDLAPNHDNSTLFTVQYIGAGHRESYPSPEEWQEKAKCINITGLCCVLLGEIKTDGNWWARVRAFNSYGTSDWAESKLFEPFEDTLIGAPDLDIRAGEVTTERIVLRVKAPKTPIYDSDTGRRMRISNIYTSIKWNITYQEVGSSFKMEKITSDKDVVLDHLYPGKRYCIAVYGSYLGRKGATRRICADTKEDVPSSGARDLFSRVDDCTRYPLRNVRLTWQPPAEKDWNGELLQYKISYREVGSFSSEMTHSLVPAGVTNFTIRDLSASKRYVVDVAACTSAGCSEQPPQHDMLRVEPFKTGTSPPYAPNVSAAPLTSTSMQISWSPLESACVQGYMVQYAPGVKPLSVDSGTTVNLTGLLPGTEYHVCVKARLASADVREFGDCDRKSGVYARTMESADDANILVQTVVPILAVVTVLLVLLCFAVLWMRGSPFLSISKINIVLPPVLVEIKETKDSALLEPISSSSNSERMDDLGSLRTSMIRQKSKFVKSLQNLPDTLTLDDDVFADEKKRLLSWKSDKDLVVKVVISREKCEDKDEPSTPTSTDSGNVSGPCSLITDSGGDDEESGSGGSVTTYHLDSPVKKNFLDPSMESPRDSKKLVVPQAMASWPDNQTSSSEIESYVRATDGTFEDDADEVFPAKGCKSQSNPYVLAENLPLLAPPFTQEFKPNTNPQVTAGAPPPNPPSQRRVTDMPVPNLLSHTPGVNSPPTQSMSSGSSIDPYVVSAVPLPPPPVPSPASNRADALDSPSSSSTSSVDPYVQAASGPRGWQNPPASSTVGSPSMSSQSDVDPYIQASSRQANRPSATQRPPDGLHRPSNNLNSSSDTSRNRDYQDPWVTK